MDLGSAVRAFVAVFPAELPDKTMVATIVLVARFQRPLPVWLGAASAFLVHVVLAVAAGQLLSLLPGTAVIVATGTLFGAGAVILWRESRRAEELDGDGEHRATDLELAARKGDLAVMSASFGVIVVAEWGDLTQLATASLAASTGAPLAVAAGALLALWSVAGLGAAAGRSLVARLPVHKLQGAAALVFAALAVLTLGELL